MPSPPKPWEVSNGQASIPTNSFSTTSSSLSSTTGIDPLNSPASLNSPTAFGSSINNNNLNLGLNSGLNSTLNMSSSNLNSGLNSSIPITTNSASGAFNTDGVPTLPSRSSLSTSTGLNSSLGGYNSMSSLGGMNSYGSYSSGLGGYGSSYSPYSSMGGYGGMSGYSSYGGYGSSYGGYGGYGSMGYSRYGRYGGMGGMGGMGMGGMGMDPNGMSLANQMQMTTQPTFQLLEGIVNTFGGFTQMLESTVFATQSSFMAMVGVADQFTQMRQFFGQILSFAAIYRGIRNAIYRVLGKKPPLKATEINAAEYQRYRTKSKISLKPLLWFLSIMVGIPYIINLVMRKMAERHQRQLMAQNGMMGPTVAMNQGASPNIEFAQASYDYTGANPGDLSFRKGDLIAVLSKTAPDGSIALWWQGRLRDGKMGSFPSNFVQILEKKISVDTDGQNLPNMPLNQQPPLSTQPTQTTTPTATAI
ncbi:hypothetical protein CONCODRAFT_82952 [Conidiobolus coronatus NRRL 28638]|uniref:Peroxisomal membrane protein PEX13 n=1 Tax=Conidiobolus coronatus (strain ATCC 28846 / CBS 209.66 / NRRL 28638) TaxID=796925 RepID=A0A137PHP5_CONC2|nr:hypothetical protein CONCODRAFT_82952 [Conidiobolus coronatus NRRL 28638]|eukprot:KXN74502.1 hypothetical protein CONCODRAFT_82952 [Conidiobolus coronatus NRRL 28638]